MTNCKIKHCDAQNDYHNETSGEIRSLPYGGGGNTHLCFDCYKREMAYRRQEAAGQLPPSIYTGPSWASLTVIHPFGKPKTKVRGILRGKK